VKSQNPVTKQWEHVNYQSIFIYHSGNN